MSKIKSKKDLLEAIIFLEEWAIAHALNSSIENSKFYVDKIEKRAEWLRDLVNHEKGRKRKV